MSSFSAVIGLEVHAQLRTESKLFCGCPNAFGGEPNTRVCPVCLGLPGALPVPNREAVRLAVRFAHAIGSDVHETSIWARKNYFYPDLPKGYQISQFDRPLATGGRLRVEPDDGPPRWVAVHRVHMEEDAGKSVHDGFGEGRSGIDLNRCGVPLVEIVGQPDIETPEQAARYLERLKSTLRALGVCDADMEKGSLRCDANVSVHRAGQPWGTKVEIKNLNSFRHVRRALAYEIDRQAQAIDRGQRVELETRLWDEPAGRTRVMRSKEEAHDYRYFPEPDLPPLVLDASLRQQALAEMPELPHARRDRFAEWGLPEADAHRLSLEPALSDYFERVADLSGNPRAAANWVLSELLREINARNLPIGRSPLPANELAELIRLVDGGKISGKIAKAVFVEGCEQGLSPLAIVRERGLEQIEDREAIEAACRQVLDAHGEKVRELRAGKERLFGFFVGQVMRATAGRARPDLVNETLRRLLADDTG